MTMVLESLHFWLALAINVFSFQSFPYLLSTSLLSCFVRQSKSILYVLSRDPHHITSIYL